VKDLFAQRNWASVEVKSQARALERFPAKWSPVRVKKTRQNKKQEPRSDSIGTEKALTSRLDEPEPQQAFGGRDDDLLVAKHAIHALGGKWKLEILLSLMNGAMRFGALRRSLNGITQHMLTMQLRELEGDGLVLRTAYAEKPLRVEYELTDAAHGLLPAFRELLGWSKLHGPRLHGARGSRHGGAACPV
jgi:DNA-binding HxlR family transcriptional regulator